MSTENLSAFFFQVGNDADLATRIAAMEPLGREEKAAALAQLSEETGTPFTAEELLTFFATPLSDEELSDVSGGVHIRAHTKPSAGGTESGEEFKKFLGVLWDGVKEYGPYGSGIGAVAKLLK